MKRILFLSFIFLLPFSFGISQPASFLPSIATGNNFIDDNGRPNSLNMSLVGMWNFGYPIAIYTSNDYLYLGSGGGVIIFDVSDSTNPEKIGNISFPGAYVRSIYVLDTLMFIGDAEKGLRIANVSDPSNPFEIGNYETYWVKGVFARNQLVYTSEFNGDSAELVIYDVSNPQSPNILSKDTLPGSNMNEVLVKDGYAYFADGYDGLRVINVSDSTNPFETGYYIPTGYTYSLSLYCDTLLLLGSVTTQYGHGGLWLINIKDPYDPYPLGCDTSFECAMDISYFSHYAYVSADCEGIKVIDFNNPSNPYIIGEFLPPGFARNIVNTNIGPYIYTGEWWGNGLRTIDASEPTQPVTIDYDPIPDQCKDVAIKGNYAYVANSYSGIYILDISDPNNPEEVSHYDTECLTYSIVIRDSIAYIADSTSILLLNISDPSNPAKISELSLICDGFGLDLDYPYLYVISRMKHYFAIVDVSNPQSPFVTGMCYLDSISPKYVCHKDTFAYVSGGAVINIADVYNPTLETYCSGCGMGIGYRGNYLYAAGGDTTINVLDISDPANPIVVNSLRPVMDYPFGLTIKDSLLYVALQIVGVEVFDISSPLTPVSVGYYCGSPLCIPLGIRASDNYVYLAADNGVFIFEYTGGSGKEEKEETKKNTESNISFNCYPITFSKDLRIEVSTNKKKNIRLQVYDISGRKIKDIYSGVIEGKRVFTWDGLKSNGIKVSSGIYFTRLVSGDFISTKKVIFVR